MIEKELRTSFETSLTSTIESCLKQLSDSWGSNNFESSREQPVEVEATSNKLQLRAQIFEPLVEFSYTYIDFPDTPCGSYSMLCVDLIAAELTVGTECKRADVIDYSAEFKLSSDCEQVVVEPTCGTLRAGKVCYHVCYLVLERTQLLFQYFKYDLDFRLKFNISVPMCRRMFKFRYFLCDLRK